MYGELSATCTKRDRKSKYLELEEGLYIWFNQLRRTEQALINDECLVEKAKYYADMLAITDLKFSDGWITKFKKRYHIASKKLHGESGSVDMSTVESNRALIKEKTKDYSPDDIYNADETSHFNKLMPNKTLASKNDCSHGIKQNIERVTLLFCCNASGTDKVRPCVIGRSKNPHCFSQCRFNPQKYVNYYFNKKAWMNSSIFGTWLQWFNSYIVRSNKNRQVLLILDNFTGHFVDKIVLSNVC